MPIDTPTPSLFDPPNRTVVRPSAIENEERIWDALCAIAMRHQPRTLKKYAELLDEEEIPPSSSKSGWKTGMVDRALKARGYTAKSLSAVWDERPSAFVTKDYPIEIYDKYRLFIAKLWDEYSRDGEWISALEIPPAVGMSVRHNERMGVVEEVRSLTKILCSFAYLENEEYSVNIDSLSPDKIFVWRHNQEISDVYRRQKAYWNRLTERQEKVEYKPGETPWTNWQERIGFL